MDKFARNNASGGDGGVKVRRTKTVIQTKTYMEGGYMKTVSEEVEITDDEEVRLYYCVSVFFFVFFF